MFEMVDPAYFTKHAPQFLRHSPDCLAINVGPQLNARHVAIIQRHRHLIEGQAVTDLGSHDGRWSWAAIDAGASSVLGIEARGDLIREAAEKCGDRCTASIWFHEASFEDQNTWDRQWQGGVVLALGVLYHTPNPVQLLCRIADCGAEHLILDTQISPLPGENLQLVIEQDNHSAAVPPAGRSCSAVLLPSRGALRTMLEYAGFTDLQWVDWRQLISAHYAKGGLMPRALANYQSGRRVTLSARRAA